MNTQETVDITALKQECEQALDELTASLTMVFKAAHRVHKAIAKLDGIEQEESVEPQQAEALAL